MTELLVITVCAALVILVGSLHRAASIRSFAKDLEFQLALERSGAVDETTSPPTNSDAALRRFEQLHADEQRLEVDDR